MKNTSYKLSGKVWLYPGMAGWHFVTLPKKAADDINFFFSESKRGWGSLKVAVTIRKSMWKTSIFPDKESGSYVLPLKADIQKKEGIKAGDTVKFSLEIEE